MDKWKKGSYRSKCSLFSGLPKNREKDNQKHETFMIIHIPFMKHEQQPDRLRELYTGYSLERGLKQNHIFL